MFAYLFSEKKKKRKEVTKEDFPPDVANQGANGAKMIDILVKYLNCTTTEGDAVTYGMNSDDLFFVAIRTKIVSDFFGKTDDLVGTETFTQHDNDAWMYTSCKSRHILCNLIDDVKTVGYRCGIDLKDLAMVEELLTLKETAVNKFSGIIKHQLH